MVTAGAEDLARFVLILAMGVLCAGVVAIGLARRRRDGAPVWALPWWSCLGWLGYIVNGAMGQGGRLNEGGLSWRWYLLAVSTAIALAAVASVLRRRRRHDPD